jgi:hypothetical protein
MIEGSIGTNRITIKQLINIILFHDLHLTRFIILSLVKFYITTTFFVFVKLDERSYIADA